MSEQRIRYFSDLTDEEVDTAVGIVRRELSDDYESGKIDILYGGDSSGLDEAALQDALWDLAGAMVKDATFIPDDGTRVVRL